jgi:hypothetical protein
LFKLAYILKAVCYKNAFTLGASARLANIVFLWIVLHSFLKLSLLMRKNEGHWDKRKMFLTVFFSHSGKVFVKTIFSCYLSRLWPMVDFLKFCQRLVGL